MASCNMFQKIVARSQSFNSLKMLMVSLPRSTFVCFILLVVNNKSSGNFTTLVCLSIYHLQEILTDNNRSKE